MYVRQVQDKYLIVSATNRATYVQPISIQLTY